MIQLPKFIQGHIHPEPHIPKKRATTTDCHSGKLVCHHLRPKHKINNQQHHEEITGVTMYIYYVNCTSLTMSSRTETYMLLRCCLYGRAGYFQPVIWQCSLEHNGNVHYDKMVHSKMGQCRLIMAAKPNLSFCKSKNWNSKPWFLGGLVPHRSALIQKVWATSPQYPLWPLQIAAVPAWLRNGDCLATTTETLLSNLKPKNPFQIINARLLCRNGDFSPQSAFPPQKP